MKSRQDPEFTNDEQYKEYLKYYFAGQALAGITVNTNSNDPLTISKNASEIASQTIERIEQDERQRKEREEPPTEEEAPNP